MKIWTAFTAAFVAACTTSTTNYFAADAPKASDPSAPPAEVNSVDVGDGAQTEVDTSADESDGGDAGRHEDAGEDPPDAAEPEDPGGYTGIGYCAGFVRFEIPPGKGIWGHRCTGYQLYPSLVSDPPTQDNCRYEGEDLTNRCVRWAAKASPLVVYYLPSDAPGQDCEFVDYDQADPNKPTCP